MDPQRPVPAGTLGNADAAEALADRLLDGCDDALRMHLIHFAVRVGARRASDGGLPGPRRLPAGRRRGRRAGAIHRRPATSAGDAARRQRGPVRRLAPTYSRLLAALRAES